MRTDNTLVPCAINFDWTALYGSPGGGCGPAKRHAVNRERWTREGPGGR